MRSSSVLFSQKFKERKGLYEKLWMLFSTKIEEGWVKNLKKRRVCLRNYGGLERHLRPSLHSQGNSVDGSPAFPPFPPTPTPVVQHQHQHQYHQHQRQHKRSNTNTHANTNTNDTLFEQLIYYVVSVSVLNWIFFTFSVALFSKRECGGRATQF